MSKPPFPQKPSNTCKIVTTDPEKVPHRGRCGRREDKEEPRWGPCFGLVRHVAAWGDWWNLHPVVQAGPKQGDSPSPRLTVWRLRAREREREREENGSHSKQLSYPRIQGHTMGVCPTPPKNTVSLSFFLCEKTSHPPSPRIPGEGCSSWHQTIQFRSILWGQHPWAFPLRMVQATGRSSKHRRKRWVVQSDMAKAAAVWIRFCWPQLTRKSAKLSSKKLQGAPQPIKNTPSNHMCTKWIYIYMYSTKVLYMWMPRFQLSFYTSAADVATSSPLRTGPTGPSSFRTREVRGWTTCCCGWPHAPGLDRSEALSGPATLCFRANKKGWTYMKPYMINIATEMAWNGTQWLQVATCKKNKDSFFTTPCCEQDPIRSPAFSSDSTPKEINASPVVTVSRALRLSFSPHTSANQWLHTPWIP